ncbi:MAG: UPF0182 family protein [Deltaproteobacteria bacterium]|nr:UPF0182 family protein [Deltaproteobacteria bacterium]
MRRYPDNWKDYRGLRKLLIGLFIALGLLLFLLLFAVDFLVNWLWFDSLGYLRVYLITLGAQSLAAVLGGAFFFLLAILNLYLAQRFSPRGPRPRGSSFSISLSALAGIQQSLKYALWGGLGLFTYVAGSLAAREWQTILMFWNGQNFGVQDPVFYQDVAFYIFKLPFYRAIAGDLLLAGIAVVLLVLIKYVQNQAIFYSPDTHHLYLDPRVQKHLLILGGILLLVFTWLFWLNRYQVLYQDHSIFFGAGYAEDKGVLTIYPVVTLLALITVGLVFANLWRPAYRLTLSGLISTVVVAILGLNLYPALLQNFLVKPNELLKENPYIQHNIKYTRLAYGLDQIQEVSYPARDTLTSADLAAAQGTLKNIKVWDKRPILSTYKQLQEIRPYYEFPLVAVDRYRVEGELRQVMLSPRELAISQLSLEARTWVNERLKFTHGYGVCLSPVNQVTPTGMPEFWLKDLPPVGKEEFKLERPEIYFGTLTKEYVLVNTKTEEFDFPAGDVNRYTHYQGSGGVKLDSFSRRLLMALKFGDLKIILSSYLGADTRILMRRTVNEMAQTLAPFLSFDAQPYPVISQGRLFWFLDAYTQTSRYPYSSPFAAQQGRFNYLRNSVKVVVDAYNGQITFYLMDPQEPLTATWRHIYPTLFRPFEAMPDHLKSHIRYPVGFFYVQAAIFRTYHMQDPQVFYNREDQWDFPSEIYEDQEQFLDPYYMVMHLPQESQEEFLLLLPYTPVRKKNMVSWLAARCDPPNYGQMLIYTFPKDKLIYGPMQIEARINQNPEISRLMTLWGQRGSRVLRGDLLALPIKDSLLYVEPLFLVSSQSQMPELKKVVVVNGPQLVFGDTLAEALKKVGTKLATPSLPTEVQPSTLLTRDPAQALSHLRQAQKYLKTGNWKGFGEEMQSLQAVLEELGAKRPGKAAPPPPEPEGD